MARTPIFRIVRRALDKARLLVTTGATPAELTQAGLTRRALLGSSLAAVALVPLAAACRVAPRVASQPRIAIVGGGIAGLHCAYRLKQAGLYSTIYEASARTGGRILTARGQLAGGQLCELGGELIDSAHLTMHALAKELALPLDDLAQDTEGLRAETFFFDGRLIEEAELVAAFLPLAKTLVASLAATEGSPGELARIDGLSLAAWLEQEAGLPADALIRRVLEVAYTIEMGLPPDQQSCLLLLGFIDPTATDTFRVFGASDERYHAHGGNDAFTTALAAQVTDQVALDHALVGIAPRDRGFALTMRTSNGDISVEADRVVLALPFTKLRQVDLTALTLPEPQRRLIQELGYGTNAKLMLQFASRPWRTAGQASGTSFTDVGELQATWETSRGQAGAEGVLTNYTGGARGVALGAGTPDERAREALPWLELVFPGCQAAYLASSALRFHWPTHPFTLGSYGCYRPGQARFAGAEGARAGNLFFCGEHTSVEFQGFMEGAAESGARVARELLDDVGVAHPPGLKALATVRARRLAAIG